MSNTPRNRPKKFRPADPSPQGKRKPLLDLSKEWYEQHIELGQALDSSAGSPSNMPQLVDLKDVKAVEISIRDDGYVVWINVDGKCRLRIHNPEIVVVDDQRKH